MPISNKPSSCSGCPLEVIGKGFTSIEGTGSLPVMLVGEASGYNEALASLPFVPSAQAGSALQRAINMTRHTRSEFSITNCIRCHPPSDYLVGASYEIEALSHCRQYLDKAVEVYKPKVMLALGATAFRNLTGLELSIAMIRGYVFRASRYPDVLVIGTWHPSFVRRGNMKYLQNLLTDLHKATLIAKGRLKEGTDYHLDPLNAYPVRAIDDGYMTHPSTDDARQFLNFLKSHPERLVTFDVENPKSATEDEEDREMTDQTITQIQFSINYGSGIAFPYEEPFISIAKEIMATPNPKANHNAWRYDCVVLRKHGFKLNGRIDDTQWLAHHLKADLLIGLQSTASWFNFPYAWKHMASHHFEHYGIADADAAYLLMNRLPSELKKRDLYGVYDREHDRYLGYEGLVYALNPVLEKVSERGIPINRVKQEEFSREIDEEKKRIEKELEPLIPEKLLKISPAEGYVRVPKEVDKAEALYESYLSDGIRQGDRLQYIYERTGLMLRKFKVSPPKPRKTKNSPAPSFADLLTEVETPPLIEVGRWCRILPFNPNSADQISNYIKHIGDEAKAKKAMTKLSKEKAVDSENGGKKKKDNLKTSAEVLKRLYQETGNQVYKLILDYKGLTKMQGTYCGGDYVPGEDGRLHSEFLFRPATLQLSSRKPNVQQYPVHSELAKSFKKIIEASEGHTFLKFDMTSFHALMVGWLAKDPNYMRLCRMDIHSYVTAHMVRLPEANECIAWDDTRLKEFLGKVKVEYKHVRDRQAKAAILGIPYGLSENGCYERFRDNFNPSEAEVQERRRKPLTGDAIQKEIQRQGKKRVKELYDLLKKLFPNIFIWQSRVKNEAHKQGYLQSPFGARREFACVLDFKYTAGGREILEQKNGEDAEKAASFYPQVNSFGHMRESMLLLEKEGLLDKYRLTNTIHDSFEFECPNQYLEEAVGRVSKIMTRESKILVDPEMGAFQCGVEVQYGRSLGEMKEWKIQ